MKNGVSYNRGVDTLYDIDHELNDQVKKLEEQIKSIDGNKWKSNELKILIALQETITKRMSELI